MTRGVHGEKIVAAINSSKISESDKVRLENALKKYDEWINALNSVNEKTLDKFIESMVRLLNDYKFYIDVDLIFDNPEDFLYRQKGQLKLDNSVLEEFLPVFVKRCIEKKYGTCDITIESQTATFSSVYFSSSLSHSDVGGGIHIRTKKQDFSMSRTLYLKSSYFPDFRENETIQLITHIAYVLAELKTNLDKTMFQEASATSHDIKQAVTGAKYYLLCDWLDMQPISTAVTDIDEILIVRKARRISQNIRDSFSTYIGRKNKREYYVNYLRSNPYAPELFKRFIDHIFSQIQNEELIEENVLNVGYF